MPKRQNPFGDSSPLQYKNRIGTKEVNLGVCSNEKMQSVYDKTKAKMFEGARRGAVPQTGNWCGNEPNVDAIIPLPGQLRLDAGGKLQPEPSQKAVQELFANNNVLPSVAMVTPGQKHINAFGQLTPAMKGKPCPFQGCGPLPTQCHACGLLRCDTLSSCAFCEKRVCPNCMRTCQQCQSSYCHVCSVLNYDDLTERAFCLHCAP